MIILLDLPLSQNLTMLEKFNFNNDDELRDVLEFMLTCIKEAYARNQALSATVEALAHVATAGTVKLFANWQCYFMSDRL